jgi:phosphate transport system substrate-binding protein
MIKQILSATLAMFAISTSAMAEPINGAGATFPAPIYSKWAIEYKSKTGNEINYQPIGSGGGIKQIEANTVDFGATDKPLTADELSKYGLIQFPTVIGGIVPILNVPGISTGQLKLTGLVLADIYLGKIKKWNDTEISSINPGIKLPNLPITVVHRSDGSGTTFVFTNYLAMKSQDWAKQVGVNDAVSWPVGQGGKGNDGVAAFVKSTIGSIGYVEYAYAKQNNITYTQLQNKDGKFVQPSIQNFSAAAAKADWDHAPGYYLLLIEQSGSTTWPITAATFILVHEKNPKNTAILNFFDYAYKNGDQSALSLNYIPLPDKVKDKVRKTWKGRVK